jgi:phosphate transport system substrate-binding protein
MSQKNETAVLVLTLLITLGLIGGAFWWLGRNSNIVGNFTNNQSRQVNSNNNQSPQVDSNNGNFNQVSNVPSGLFNYGGSTTWAPIRKDVDSIIQKEQPQFRLRYTDPTTGAPGSGSGIKMLLNNQLAFSQSSRSLKPEEQQQAEQLGFKLVEVPVAIDGIAIAVNPGLNIPGLTVAQIKDIYLGKITNWQQLGGENLPIIPYSRRIEEGGTIEFFAENVLEKEKFGNNVQFIPTTTQALREVAKNPGGIYYASAPEVVGQCGVKPLPIGRKTNEFVPPYQQPLVLPSECPQKRNQLNSDAFQSGEYPITRRLFVIVKQNNQSDQQAGEAYANLLLTSQGQELIAKTGFVRIK